MLYISNTQNSRTQKVSQEDGFIATTAIILFSASSLAFALVVTGAAMTYADSVTRQEYRIQKALNQEACEDTRDLILAKDYFFSGSVTIPELQCIIQR